MIARLLLLSSMALSLLAGCQPKSSPPPSATELIGGPCKYEEAPAVAIVSDADAEQVRFLIDERIVPYSRDDLPKNFRYDSGLEFRVIEKRITEGTCTPYILEVVGPMTPVNEHTPKWKYPDPAKIR